MEKDKEIRKNPFFLDYDTQHGTIPFDRIRFEDYEEAFMEGIRRDKEEIEKTVNDPEEPTFENTIVRVDTSKGEHYYDLLDRVSKVFSNMLNAETNDALDELAQKMSPILNKKQMTEEDIKLQYITPAITSKWDVQKITMETQITDGKVNLKGLATWQKAEKIISVAHPDFRDDLIKEAEAMKIWRKSNKR